MADLATSENSEPIGTLKISVDTTELDSATEKAERLVELLQEADRLCGVIGDKECNGKKVSAASLVAMCVETDTFRRLLEEQERELIDGKPTGVSIGILSK